MVLSAVLLTGLAGCADRPNDLETYYDKPDTPATTSTPAPATAQGAPADPAAAASSSARQAIAEQVSAAVLTKGDLAGEGVHAATQRAENGACFAAVPAGDPRGASWTYPSGSTFTQQVTGYLDESAADVLARVQCEGQKLTVPLPAGAEAVRGWCASGTCTVLLAAGHVLSGLQVQATTTTRASDAIKGLAPLAAGKLPTTQG
ncbi:hypothetical protein FHX82_004060 [Amycolatopsis bartoniae]|uniref:DUF3558 domain-containing protein n=1 Tax=Amycolatopsis bartoniae TaxID=941986 RepID=A0A8H9MAV4_9PSEU|nr:hypothetical protein [Amycolatopsis bartoniae]MBB2936996.1 hypothetical protein [Amycolatopsis bartoniae]GHF51713.1 hypothetical protein GCM10017566_26170 [Amycolatopsis bartoniae]